jgi:WD40 repeat protein
VIPLNLYRLDPATGTLSLRIRSAGYTYLWSPDSRFIATITYDHEITIMDARTMTPQTRTFAELHHAAGIVWTPDNRLLFLAREAETDPNFQGYSLEPETNTLEPLALTLPVADTRAPGLTSRASPG